MKNRINIIVLLVVLLIIIAFFNSRESNIPVWEENALELSQSLSKINRETTIDNLKDFTEFNWDTLYGFEPYLPEDNIYKVVGYKWTEISSTVSEGMNQVVFLDNGKVICYIYGYPEKYNVYFDLGTYKDGYCQLSSSEKLTFKMKLIDDIRYLKYLP